MTDTTEARGSGTKARVFISCSRKDMAFADRLEAALKARGFDVLIDRQEIYAFEDWWKRIEALIGRADTVVFVLSPDAVKSDVALKEITYAASLNKRFAPIVCRRAEDSAVSDTLRRLNFVFFDDPEHFDASADALAMLSKPTSTGLGSTQNMARLSAGGHQKDGRTDCSFNRQRWSTPNTGLLRAHETRLSLRKKFGFTCLQAASERMHRGEFGALCWRPCSRYSSASSSASLVG